jgi:hypothetical protein
MDCFVAALLAMTKFSKFPQFSFKPCGLRLRNLVFQVLSSAVTSASGKSGEVR